MRLLTYGADDPGILGYINLPEGPKEFTLTAQTENGITVTITGDTEQPLVFQRREVAVVKPVIELDEDDFADVEFDALNDEE